jgi:three-Cys-motif partner protein
VLWRRDPHTEAKHDILRRYLEAWWRILLQSTFRKLTFFDGFAGPGEYEGGEEGSPCIAVRTLLDCAELIADRPINLIFLEADPRRHRHLEQLIGSKFSSLPPSVKVRIEHGLLAEEGARLLDETKAWGGPIFANLDTWRIGDIPFDLMRRVGSNRSSELLATFLPEYFVRFGDPGFETVLEHGHRQFGSSLTWVNALRIPDSQEREVVLVEEYRQTLASAGFQFRMPFALSNFRNYTIYLIYATRNKKGVEKMKDSMWRVDPISGTSFKDPRNPNQLELGFNEPNLTVLQKSLEEALCDGGRTVQELKEEFFDTMYKTSHITKALEGLRAQGRLGQEPKGRLIGTVQVWLL